MPLFLIAVAVSVYLNYLNQEKQTFEQAQLSAHAQAEIIHESLVQMMITNLRIDDKYLEQINSTGELENLHVIYKFDSLYLRDELLDESRIERLLAREKKLAFEPLQLINDAYATSEPIWIMSCDLHSHNDKRLNTLQSSSPIFFSECERLKILLPFRAEKKCQQCHNVPLGKIIGAAYMEVTLAKTARLIRANAYNSMSIFLGFTIIATLLGAFIFRTFVAKPVTKLVEATEVIGSGTLDTEIAHKFANDEVGKLARSFMLMQQRLKEAQKELINKERLSLVGQMASSIIHDFRNPMTGIGLAIDLLATSKTLTDIKRNEMYERIHSSLDRMNKMTQELLDFSRGESKLSLVECTGDVFMKKLYEAVHEHLSAKNIQCIIEQTYFDNIVLDKDKMFRALINIVNNAEDVMQKGGTLTLGLSLLNEKIQFFIRDTGGGIPEEVRATIFEPFVSAGKAKGTGLGLAISKRIAEQHGGTIWFETELGNGTAFYLAIPRNKLIV